MNEYNNKQTNAFINPKISRLLARCSSKTQNENLFQRNIEFNLKADMKPTPAKLPRDDCSTKKKNGFKILVRSVMIFLSLRLQFW